MLVLTRKLNESILIGDQIKVTVVRTSGSQVRIGIEAPRDVRVVRGEIPRFADEASGNDSTRTPDRTAPRDTSTGPDARLAERVARRLHDVRRLRTETTELRSGRGTGAGPLAGPGERFRVAPR